tara:strand:- start:26 stop:739 length:714 start_codon:yes stop_codon:yes gene_type:complete
MKLSIIVCAHNEKDTILEVFSRIKQVDLGNEWTKEIIVVDNVSTDGTREILEELNDEDIKVIYQKRNIGKGHSVLTAIPQCNGDYIIPQDADLEYHPKEYVSLIEKAQNENLDVVYGSRVRKDGRRYHVYRINELGTIALTWLTNILFGTSYTDVATCYKLMNAKLLRSLELKCTGFDLDFELSAKFSKNSWRIGEVFIDYKPRTYGKGRKLLPWRNGFMALRVILREWAGMMIRGK